MFQPGSSVSSPADAKQSIYPVSSSQPTVHANGRSLKAYTINLLTKQQNNIM